MLRTNHTTYSSIAKLAMDKTKVTASSTVCAVDRAGGVGGYCR
jgi:hypothetical protein